MTSVFSNFMVPTTHPLNALTGHLGNWAFRDPLTLNRTNNGWLVLGGDGLGARLANHQEQGDGQEANPHDGLKHRWALGIAE